MPQVVAACGVLGVLVYVIKKTQSLSLTIDVATRVKGFCDIP